MHRRLALAGALALALFTPSAEGQVQRFGGIVANDLVVGVDGQLYAATETGISLVTTTGLTPVLVTGAEVFEIEQLPDGTFIYLTYAGVSRAPAGGPSTPVRLVQTGGSGALTRATDGAVWFSTSGLQFAFGRIDPNGTVLDVPQPVPVGHLAPAQGGAVWTVRTQQEIALVSRTGQVTNFPLPPNVAVFDIAPGPAGSVYLATGNTGLMVMTPSGLLSTVFQYLVGNLAVGPDGTIYMSGFNGQYARLSGNQLYTVTDPSYAAFAACFDGYQIMDMVVGPDGALWVAQRTSQLIILLPPRPAGCPPYDPVRDSAILRIAPAAFAAAAAAAVPSLGTVGLYSLGALLVAFALLRLR